MCGGITLHSFQCECTKWKKKERERRPTKQYRTRTTKASRRWEVDDVRFGQNATRQHNINELMCWLFDCFGASYWTLEQCKTFDPDYYQQLFVFSLSALHLATSSPPPTRLHVPFRIPLIGSCSPRFERISASVCRWHCSHFLFRFNLFENIVQCDFDIKYNYAVMCCRPIRDRLSRNAVLLIIVFVFSNAQNGRENGLILHVKRFSWFALTSLVITNNNGLV